MSEGEKTEEQEAQGPTAENVTIQECLNVIAAEVRSPDPNLRVRAASALLDWIKHQDQMVAQQKKQRGMMRRIVRPN